MRKHLFFWEAAGFAVTAALGTLLHFVYQWSGENTLAASFSGVNESTWEHMKLLFVPVFLFSVVQMCCMGRSCPNFLAVRGTSVLAGLALIPVLYYTYTGVWGDSVAWVNIAIFFLADLGMFMLDDYLLRQGRRAALWAQLVGLAVLWGLAFLFIWCTFRPPHIALWQDPVTGGFGIENPL